jgi:hypothetical protein
MPETVPKLPIGKPDVSAAISSALGKIPAKGTLSLLFG